MKKLEGITMKFEDKYNINPEFDSLFKFESEKDELKHDAKLLMFRFLSEIERISEDGVLQKKHFASALKTSASFITQLFKGDKIANLITLAKLQKKFNVVFEVRAVPADQVSLSVKKDDSALPTDYAPVINLTANEKSLRAIKGSKLEHKYA